jgi:hypothetical protein
MTNILQQKNNVLHDCLGTFAGMPWNHASELWREIKLEKSVDTCVEGWGSDSHGTVLPSKCELKFNAKSHPKTSKAM